MKLFITGNTDNHNLNLLLLSKKRKKNLAKKMLFILKKVQILTIYMIKISGKNHKYSVPTIFVALLQDLSHLLLEG